MAYRSLYAYITTRESGCTIDPSGTSGEFSINSDNGHCSWRLGKDLTNISFVIVKFQPFHLGRDCMMWQESYIEVTDINNQSETRECGGWRSFAVLIKSRPAVVRLSQYHSWWGFNAIHVSFNVILKEILVQGPNKLSPRFTQTKGGSLTVTWEPSMLPSKRYTVVPLYNDTVKEEPFTYIIELKNDSSFEVENLKPGALYSFQVIAFDSNSTRRPLIVSTKEIVVGKSDTVRLVGGQLPNEGRVEVFENGLWNTICSSHQGFGKNEAKVTCRSLRLPGHTNYGRRSTFGKTSFPVHHRPGFICSGNESSLVKCNSENMTDRSGYCATYMNFQAYVVCGSSPVLHHNITKTTGVITSPGYPFFMMQADYRWIFAHNISNGRLAVQFDEFDLWRRYGTSRVYVRELSLPFNQVHRDAFYRGKLVMLLRLPAQVRFYSPFTSYNEDMLWSNDGKGMRFRFLVYSEPEDGVPLLKKWTVTLSSPEYSMITASWSQISVTDYDVIGFVMSCNSTEEWAKKLSYAVGENNSTSLSCLDLVGYTRYKVHVLVQLRKRGYGVYMVYRSLYESITTKESVPKVRPSRVSSPNVSQTTAVVLWGPISRKDAHGVLLGYIIELYSYYARNDIKEMKTNSTSILIDDLRPANRYRADVRGYTAVGSGPSTSYYFATECGGIKTQLQGKIYLSKVYPRGALTCTWRLSTPTMNTLVLLRLDSLETPSSLNCKDFYLLITDGLGNEIMKLCGSRRSMSFVSIGSTEIKVYLKRGHQRNFNLLSSFFMLTSGIDKIPYFNEPWSLSFTPNSSTSVSVSWEKYPGKQYVRKYIVIFNANNSHGNISSAYAGLKNNSVIVHNLLKFTEYKVRLLALFGHFTLNFTNIDETMVKSQEVVFKTAEDVPSKPPQDITAKYLGSNTVVVSWKKVADEFTNGVVIGYYVYYREVWSGSHWNKEYITSDKTRVYLKNLKDAAQYRIEVSAATKIGEGPRSRGFAVKTACQHILSGEYGTFETPCYPNKCPQNINCTWMIFSFNSSLVAVIFEKFDIGTGIKEDNCSKDFVKTFDKFGNESSHFCGQKGAFAVVSAQKEALTIMHRSDGGQKRGGFQALYFQLQPGNKAIYPQVDAVNATTASFYWKQLSSIQWFYVLYKPDEADQNWNVINTTSQNVTIVGLLPSTQYIAKIFGKSSSTVYWSSSLAFMTHPVCALVH